MTAVVVRDRRKGILLLSEALFDLFHLPETSTGAMLRKQLVSRQDVPDQMEPCHRCGGSWAVGPDTKIRYAVNPGAGLVKSRYRRGRPCPNEACPGVCSACGDPCEDCGGYLETTDDGPVKHPGTGLIAVDSHIEERHRRDLSSEEAGTKPGRIETWLCNVCMGSCVEPKLRGPGGPTDRIPCRTCNGNGEREHSPFVLAGVTDTGPEEPQSCSRCYGRGVEPRNPQEPCRGELGPGGRRVPCRIVAARGGRDIADVVVERAIEHRDQEGSYHELELCLAELRRRSKHRHRVYWQVHVLGERTLDDLNETEARWREEAIVDLDKMMPDEIRVPWSVLHAEKAKRDQLREVKGREMDPAATARRDQEIRRRQTEDGHTPAQLAAEFGLSTRQVQRILYGTAA